MVSKPRYYQQEAIDTCKGFFERGTYNGIVQLPTGTGKSLVQQELIRQLFPIQKFRTILIGGLSRSLNFQARDGINYQYPETAYPLELGGRLLPGSGLIMGSNYNAVDARAMVGSAQTLGPKILNLKGKAKPLEAYPIEKSDVCIDRYGGITLNPNSKREYLIGPRFDQILKNGRIDLWIHDEAHHAPADGTLWMTKQLALIYDHLGLDPLRHVGFTATPIRNDGKALSNIYELIYYARDDRWAVEEGFIVPVADAVRVAIKTNQGRHDQLKMVENWMDRVYEGYMDHCHLKRKCTASFVGPINGIGGVDASRQLHAYFNGMGIPTAHVDGEYWIDPTGKKRKNSERKHLWAAVNAGLIPHLTNNNVLVEGIDLPIIDAIQLLRPVNEVNFTQIMGRARRPFPGKTDALLVDYTGQELVMVVHGQMTGIDVDVFKDKPEPTPADIGRNTRDVNADNIVQGVSNVYSTQAIKRKSDMVWYRPPNGNMSMAVSRKEYGSSALLVTMPDHTKADYYKELMNHANPKVVKGSEILHSLYRSFTLWHVQYNKVVNNSYVKQLLEFDLLEDFASTYARTIEGFDKSIATKNKSWRKGTMSEKQMPLFMQLFPDLNPMSYSGGEASQMISHKLADDVVKKLIDRVVIDVESNR